MTCGSRLSSPQDRIDHELLLWMNDLDARDTYTWGYEHKVLAPDAYARYRFGERVVSFFLDLDRATMAAKRRTDKVKRYQEYANSGRYEERFGMKLFRVVVVTTSTQRLTKLLKAAAQQTQRAFWFATLGDLTERGVGSAIWRKVGSTEQAEFFS